MKLPGILVALLLFVAPLPVADEVDAYIQAEMKTQQIPGLALAVVRHGRLVKAQGYGIADLDNDVPVTPDTVFELASITKQFTASLIMMLVEDQKLRLDDKLASFLVDPPDAWKAITIYQLLTHTAGLAPLGDDFKSMVWRTSVSTADLYAAARNDPIGSAPGETWSYSDVGYFLLGMVIEKVTGQRYEEVLSQRILQPLNMTSSRMLDHLRPLKHLAKGYTVRADPAANGARSVVNIRRVVNVELAPHFGLFSTVKDLAKWDAALYAEKPLKQASLERMWTPARVNDGTARPYGFGWELSQKRGHKVVGHSGLTGTYILRVRDMGLTVIVLTNLGAWTGGRSTGANARKIATDIAELLEPQLKREPMSDRDPEVTSKVRTLVAGLREGALDRSLVSPELAKALSAEMDGISRYFTRFGTVESVVLVDRFDNAGERVFVYRLASSSASRIFEVRVGPGGTFTYFEPED